ncbi:MAG: hypothetical protein FJX53_13030, partial [Alphaproteobacteria bacterium]|nr:hypothetical protein [Alphaproteobacteria bacterium]
MDPTLAHPRFDAAPPAAAPRLLLDGRPGWQRQGIDGAVVHWTGDAGPALAVARAIAATGFDPARAAAALAATDGHFALAVAGANAVIASVDICRSTPLFHATSPVTGTVIGSDARAVRDAGGATGWDPVPVLEFAMSGYVTGSDTLVRGLRQLRAGELLHVAADGQVRTARWFDYCPAAAAQRSERALREELMAAIDAATDRAIARATG